jgi:endonuclease YncB( thermonuclease family)/outer membrane protein OmpA-like peptidoglycan-associated protein
MTQAETVGRDSRSYRQGLVLGLTMAEVFLLLVFILLIALAALWAQERQRRATAEKDLSTGTSLTRDDLKLLEDIKAAISATSRDDVTKAIEHLRNGRDLEPLTGAEKDFIAVVRAQQRGTPREAIPDDWRALARAARDLKNLSRNIDVVDAVNRALPGDKNPSRVTWVIKQGLAVERKGEHDWPPIINLSDARGYHFATGKAELRPEFEAKLRESIVPQLLDLAKRYRVTTIEVIGHTDEQKIAPRSSNLDAMLLDVLQDTGNVSGLMPADNAGLGLARAAAVVRVLRRDGRLRDYTLLPLSGGQLIGVDDKLTSGGGGDERERRRIEIRVRRANTAQTSAGGSAPQPGTATQPAGLTGRVNLIVDGDTFDMQVGRRLVRIRICGINSPEKGEAGYERARDFLYGRIMGRMLRCVPVGEGTVCDGRSSPLSHGRMVAQCFVDPDGDIAVPIVESGNACDWPHFSGGHYQNVTQGRACVESRVY